MCAKGGKTALGYHSCRIIDVSVVLYPKFDGQEHGELQFRSDLLDCHVDVCSPEVLVQISDNFDYQVCAIRTGNWKLRGK